MPESDEFGLILKDVTEIYSDIREKRTDDLMIFDEIPVQNLTGDLSKLQVSKLGNGTPEEPEEEPGPEEMMMWKTAIKLVQRVNQVETQTVKKNLSME